MDKTAEAISLVENTIQAQKEKADLLIASSQLEENMEVEEWEENGSVDLHLVNICAELCMTVGLWERAANLLSAFAKCKHPFPFSAYASDFGDVVQPDLVVNFGICKIYQRDLVTATVVLTGHSLADPHSSHLIN